MIKLGFYSGADLPKISIRPQLIDYILMGVAFVLNLFMWIYAFHLQKNGLFDMDSHLLLMITMTLMVVGLSILFSFISSTFFRLPYKLTPQNIFMQYLIALRFCRVICIWIAFWGALMVYKGEGDLFQIVSFVILGLLLIAYYVIAYLYR